MARGLFRLYVLGEKYPARQFFHVKHFDKEGARGEFGVLSSWELVVEQQNYDNQKKTSGMWAVTEFGKRFVLQQESVPQYVILKWGSELLGFAGRYVSAKECLEHGNKFKYDELMQWTPGELSF